MNIDPVDLRHELRVGVQLASAFRPSQSVLWRHGAVPLRWCCELRRGPQRLRDLQ